MKLLPHIIHSDAHILVVNKPSGWLSIPDRFDANKPNLTKWLKSEGYLPRVVHRLDKETSGAIIFALTEDAHRHLSRQFEQRETVKIYQALVDGSVYENEGLIDAPIGEDPQQGGKMKITKSGKESQTRWRIIERFKRFTLVEAMILTGRMHQIRVHLKSIGHPLAIDALYGSRSGLFMSEIKNKGYKLGKWVEEELPLMGRTTLHSHRLRIHHPNTQEEMTFVADHFKDFKAVLNQLQNHDALA